MYDDIIHNYDGMPTSAPEPLIREEEDVYDLPQDSLSGDGGKAVGVRGHRGGSVLAETSHPAATLSERPRLNLHEDWSLPLHVGRPSSHSMASAAALSSTVPLVMPDPAPLKTRRKRSPSTPSAETISTIAMMPLTAPTLALKHLSNTLPVF